MNGLTINIQQNNMTVLVEGIHIFK
uniref:Uncharacterized protein n=1 Tax=Anguilla anguilla TaxID=7936 RepID=A0A0E9Q5W5_ANGAN